MFTGRHGMGVCDCSAAVLCFGSMVQVNWQEEASRARRVWMEAHKDVPADILQQAISSADVEQPLESPFSTVPEQSGLEHLPKCICPSCTCLMLTVTPSTAL